MCAGVSAILLSGNTRAADQKPQAPCKGAAGPPHERARLGMANMGIDFKSLDTDGDSFLSFDEFGQSARLSRIDAKKRRKLFDYLDRNNDGQLHMRELRFQPPRYIAVLRKEFDRLDSDGSGGLNFAEFSKAAPLDRMDEEVRMRLFKRLDKNRDQLIQHTELRVKGFQGGRKGHHSINFKKYDVNSSGGLDFEEFSKLPWLARIPEDRKKMLFLELDRDKNGEVLAMEVRSAWAHRRKSCSPDPSRQKTKKRSDN